MKIDKYPGLDKLPSGKIRSRYRDRDGVQHSRTFGPREIKLASAWRNDRLAEVRKGTHVTHSRITVAAFAAEYAASRAGAHSPRTVDLLQGRIKLLDVTNLGQTPIASVRQMQIQSWISALSQRLAPSTLRGTYGFLRSIFNAAVDEKLISSSPCPRRPVMPPKPRERVVPLTVEQVQDLAAAMPKRYSAMVITQAGLGLRAGELFGLMASDIDWLHRSVSIVRQLAPRARSFSKPKTPASVRTIPLPSVVADALSQHMQAYPPRADGLIFTVAGDDPVRHGWYSEVFRSAVEESGLPKSTTSHDLRHAYASLLLHAGQSVVAVASVLGHDDGGKLVLSTYAHLLPDQEDHTRQAVDLAWRVTDAPRDQAARR
jgi:integrase